MKIYEIYLQIKQVFCKLIIKLYVNKHNDSSKQKSVKTIEKKLFIRYLQIFKTQTK